MNKPTLSLFISFLSISTLAQEKLSVAEPLQVSSKPLVSVQQTGQDVSIATNLISVPGVVVVVQGEAVGQSDLSIRGSSFSGAGLSLFGLSLGNAQTEHFNADLPFPAWWFAQPVVLTGVQQAEITEGHLTGTVNLVPMPIQNETILTGGIDNKDGYWGNGSAQHVIQHQNGSQTGVGVFAGYSEIPDVDFQDNNVKVARGGARYQHLNEHGQSDVLFGYQDKSFGATGYYGVNPNLKAEEKTEDALLTGNWQSNDPDSALTASILLRQFKDDYTLWLPTSLFNNQHTTRSIATQVGRNFLFSDTMNMITRFAADYEEIESNSLGDFSRYRVVATAIPEWQLTDDINVSIGVKAEFLEDEDFQLLPLARIDYAMQNNLHAHAEISQSVRRPSYTELNYESPGSLGNTGLALQKETAAELGIRFDALKNTSIQAIVFGYQTSDTVDWVRPDATATRWMAENIGEVETIGTELTFTQHLHETLDLSVSYTWMDKDSDESVYSSRYALDYAQNLVQVQLNWMPLPWMRVELSQLYRDQVPNALRTEGGHEQWLSNIACHFRIPHQDHIQFTLASTNATKDDYRVYPGQDTVTNRRVSAALTMDW
ncbi:hypothetical protein P3T73_15875 [Kiritimatiellota bacterium B12222]|nr:hypothetical protein P3T73_15875 [Kiritimatiellota bacterium B12222]